MVGLRVPQPLAIASWLFQHRFFASGYTVIVRPDEALLAVAMLKISCIVSVAHLPLSAVGLRERLLIWKTLAWRKAAQHDVVAERHRDHPPART
jgi:hypothetical protein